MRKFFHSKYFYAVITPLTIASGALFLFWPTLSEKVLFNEQGIGFYFYWEFSVMKYFVYGLHMLPNWWPAYNSGYPISLTFNGFLNPLSILTLKFLPPFLANNLINFVFFILNGLSLYALCRALKLSRTGSLIAAISYAFSGAALKHIGQTVFLATMPFLPLSFLCCLKILLGKTKWLWLWLPLLVYSWFGGFTELTVYSLVAVGFFSVYLLFKNRKSENFSYRRLILFFGAVALSVIILLPWFLSILHFVSLSNRSGGVDVEAASKMPTSLSTLINMFYPRIYIPYGELLPFISFGNFDYLLYIGTLPLLLILTSLFIKHKKEKGYFLFFLYLAAGSVLMTINHSPLFWLFHRIPVLRWFTAYWKWSFVIVFSLAILAGYGIDHIKDFFKNRFSKIALAFFGTLMIIALLGSGFIAVFDQKIKTTIISYGLSHYKNTPDRAFNRSEDYYRHVITRMTDSLVDTFSLKNKWVLLMFTLWFIALIYLLIGKREFISHEKWLIAAVFITFLGSTLPWVGLTDGPPASYLKTEPATAKYLHSINPYQSNKLPLAPETSQSLIPYRIFIYTPYQFIAAISEKYGVDFIENRLPFTREAMDNNVNIMFNFDTLHNRQPLGWWRLSETYGLASREQIITKEKESYQDTTPFDEYIKAFSEEKNMRLLGSLNIQYILTSFKLSNKLQPIFVTYIFDNKLPVYIYENPYFMPRWYFAENIKWTNEDRAFEDLQKIEDFKKTTLLETINLNDPALSYKSSPKDKMELQLYTAGKLILKTNTKNYRFLIFSESRQPFWQATVNGNPVPLYTANYLYQAVLVPPGENTVEFRYPNLWEQSVISAQLYIQSFINKLAP